MKKIKKQFWGYSPAEVDEFITDLQQQKKTVAEHKKKILMTEIEHVEKMLEKYMKDELIMLESLTLKIIANDGIVHQAREKSQIMKNEALHNLQTHKARLCELHKILQDVYTNLEQVKGNFQDGNKSCTPLAIVAKGAGR